jgi:lipoate-protein ligase A
MKKVVKFVSTRGFPLLELLKYEELLLRQTNDNYFIFNYGHKIPSIVLGYSGKVNELVEVKTVAR